MNLVKCSNCGKILIAELFDAHECDIPLCKKVIEIPVQFYVECTTKKRESMVGAGLDGNQYWFVVKKREPLPWHPSDERYHHFKSDGEVPESKTRTLKYLKSGRYIALKQTPVKYN